MKHYLKSFLVLLRLDLLRDLIICLNTFIKSFLVFLCKNFKDMVIIKLNDKKKNIYYKKW